MKSLKLNPGKFLSTIQLPGSKSYANRVLILGALKPGKFTIHDLPESTDVTILADCLRQIGLKIKFSGTTCEIEGSFPECEIKAPEITVGEGGSTARFLASLLMKGQQPYTLLLGERLKERPWQEFIDLVNHNGGKATLAGNKLTIQGPVTLPSKLEVDCARTTQFASGVQLAFETTDVKPVNMSSSESYWKMTTFLQQMINDSDIFCVPLDWSSASYPLAFGALNQEIFFPGLSFDQFQADAKFFNLLDSLGMIKVSQKGLSVIPKKMARDLSVDVSDALDLVPALAFFLAHIEGSHKLTGIANLQHKESDRLAEVLKLLKEFERTASTDGKTLVIEGKTQIITVKKDLVFPDDHRMVMAGSLFLLHHGGGSVSPSEAVAKSFPRFFDLLES